MVDRIFGVLHLIRSLFLFLACGVCISAPCQEVNVQHGTIGIWEFHRQFGNWHDPVFALRYTSPMLPGSEVARDFNFIGYLIGYAPHRLNKSPEIIPAGAASVLGQVIQRNDDHSYMRKLDPHLADSVLGDTIRFMTLPQADYKMQFSGQSYAPLSFVVNGDWQPVTLDSLGVQEKPNIIRPGALIKWNADPKNDKGVYVTVHYSSGKRGNEFFYYREMVDARNTMKVPDNGSAILPKALFRDVPRGALFTLSLLRGSWSFLKDAEGTPTKVPLVISSECFGDFRYYR
ncbi:hypothetical protein EPD60_11800 [Flaviaesturariibacter flavus]|uniref:Uncharacterized protein n=1 Tax=Flaviaesturariibacter flavus TaxID=2502780 RepID=A0A4R1BA00_9BACT|nr:hypothetical protein [Flaviaesturariibacter flavus]TCJ13771.1 hypothetical protein EPD60_11800 [Flaviaesturariibacter flavus]